MTLHEQGQHVRNWLHVQDNCAAIELVLDEGKPGEIYNLGGGTDLTGRELTAKLLALCGAGKVQAVVAGIEADLEPLTAMAARLEAAGVRLWLPDAWSGRACTDKALFHDVLTEHGIATPRTWRPEDIDQVPEGAELVVKPRRGHGAQNVHFVRRREHARVLCDLVPEPIAQRRIYGSEFTADCLVDDTGRPSVILRRRDLVKAGLAAVSTTFENPAVHDLVVRTLAAVRARGLCCVQGFVQGDGARSPS